MKEKCQNCGKYKEVRAFETEVGPMLLCDKCISTLNYSKEEDFYF